ncbi:ribonuclease H-like domain-containing protein [Tanacetum coccineum]
MTNLSSLNYFLGISVVRYSSRIFLSQRKYDAEILERARMVHCNPSRTPIDIKSKLEPNGDPVSDPTLYQSLACALHYPTFTSLDISYAVQQVYLYMHDPREPHFSVLKQILRYVHGTLDHALQLLHLPLHLWLLIQMRIGLVALLLDDRLQVRVLHVSSCYQFVDIFTKRLPSTLFEEFRTSLSVRCPPAQAPREC